MTELEYVRANYCSNRDVATGNYDCPYAITVMNTICCRGNECNYKGIYEKPVVNNLTEEERGYIYSDIDIVSEYIKKKVKEYGSLGNINPTPYEDIAANLLANSLSDDKFPF